MSQPIEQGERFKFTAFAEQDPNQQKVHRILLPIQIEPIDESLRARLAEACGQCNEPQKQIKREYSYGWGEQERLEIVVNNTPEIVCGCGEFMDDWTRTQITEAGRPIRTALELYGFTGDKTNFELVRSVLTEEDILKMEDFANHRWNINSH